MGSSHLISKAISAAEPALPITLTEFVSVLLRTQIWDPNRWMGKSPKQKAAKPIALAVSGGVDSMALAVLCTQLKNHDPNYSPRDEQGELILPNYIVENLKHFRLRALVVDHGVREDSSVEAEKVAGVLKSQLDLNTDILKIAWPPSSDPHEASDFESQAREHRFQLLGRRCEVLGIESLLLAHHQDDQAETILARMAAGHKGRGLFGIRAQSEIPECHGIHGVHESGSPRFFEEGFPNAKRLRKYQLPVEGGGVRVYRPLLEFSKARLIATCLESKMAWFEDPTNSDPTLTTRNAIRHLYSHHQVPAALSKDRLLSLSQTISKIYENKQRLINTWLDKCDMTLFSTMHGVLEIRFVDLSRYVTDQIGQFSGLEKEKQESESVEPKPLVQNDLLSGSAIEVVDDPKEHLPQSTPNHNFEPMAAELLRRVIMLVSPKEKVATSTLHDTVNRIFPELLPTAQRLNTSKPEAFTVAGVFFQPLEIPDQESSASDRTPKCRYRISRQPLKHVEVKELTTLVSTAPFTTKWGPWHLYDNRFWIRFQLLDSETTTKHKIYLTPFRPEYRPNFISNPPYPNRIQRRKLRFDGIVRKQSYERFLKLLGPGRVRFTLPAIVMDLNETTKNPADNKLLGLPSMKRGFEGVDRLIRWECRYKKLYLDGFRFNLRGRSSAESPHRGQGGAGQSKENWWEAK